MNARLALILWLACGSACGADSLGRLFHTPEQRAILDATRRAVASGAGAATTGPGVEVSGLVTRSDGRRSTWVNGRVEHGHIERNASPGGVRVQLPGGTVELKVGQVLDPATGTVREIYRRPPKPAAVQAGRPVGEGSAPPATSVTTSRDHPDDDDAEPPPRQ